MGKRVFWARLLSKTGFITAALHARRRFAVPVLTVLTYHRVAEARSAGELDPEIIDAEPSFFAQQLDFLREHFTVISIADLIAHVHGAPLPRNPAIITFDDGYREDVTCALPMLQERGLCATFFIATAYPGTGRLYWWDRLALYLRRSKNDRVELGGPLRMTLHPKTDFAGSSARLLYLVKRTAGLDHEALFTELSRATGVVIDPDEERELARSTIMDWNDITLLASRGMDIESHSHFHRVIGTMSERELADDLRASRDALAERIGRRPRALAYPVGHAPGPRHRAVIRALGFELGFTNATGLCTGRIDPLDVPRFAMDRSLGFDLFRASATIPYLERPLGGAQALLGRLRPIDVFAGARRMSARWYGSRTGAAQESFGSTA